MGEEGRRDNVFAVSSRKEEQADLLALSGSRWQVGQGRIASNARPAKQAVAPQALDQQARAKHSQPKKDARDQGKATNKYNVKAGIEPLKNLIHFLSLLCSCPGYDSGLVRTKKAHCRPGFLDSSVAYLCLATLSIGRVSARTLGSRQRLTLSGCHESSPCVPPGAEWPNPA